MIAIETPLSRQSMRPQRQDLGAAGGLQHAAVEPGNVLLKARLDGGAQPHFGAQLGQKLGQRPRTQPMKLPDQVPKMRVAQRRRRSPAQPAATGAIAKPAKPVTPGAHHSPPAAARGWPLRIALPAAPPPAAAPATACAPPAAHAKPPDASVTFDWDRQTALPNSAALSAAASGRGGRPPGEAQTAQPWGIVPNATPPPMPGAPPQPPAAAGSPGRAATSTQEKSASQTPLRGRE